MVWFFNLGADLIKNLKLVYKLPKQFEMILSTSILDRYSKIFSFLLSLYQVQEAFSRIHVTSDWKNMKSTQYNHDLIIKFMQLSKCFIFGIQQYCFHIAVGVPWLTFTTEINTIASQGQIFNLKASHCLSVDMILNLQEECISEIFWRLFLNEDQKIIQTHIEDLTSIVIKFSRIMQNIPIPDTLAELYFDFSAKYKSLLNLLDQSGSKRQVFLRKSSRDVECFEQLFVLIDYLQ